MLPKAVSPLCPVVKTTRSDRPIRVHRRSVTPGYIRARSDMVGPSVAVGSYTAFESRPVTVGVRSAPPSADRPNILTTFVQERSAPGILFRGSRRRAQNWCYPGRGTPSAPRTASAPTAAVRVSPVGMDDVFDLGTRLKRVRVPMVYGLISIVKSHSELKPNQSSSGTVNACDGDSVVLNAVGHSEQSSRLGMCTGGDFSNSTVSDRIDLTDPSENRSSDVSASVFPLFVSLL